MGKRARFKKRRENKLKFHVDEYGQLKEVALHSDYMIIHTKKHLTYDRLHEHIEQYAVTRDEFYGVVCNGDEYQRENMLEKLHLTEIKNPYF